MVSPGSHVINPYQSTEVVSPQGVSVVVYRGLRSEQLDDTRQLARTILFLPYWGGSARTFQYVQEGLAKIRPDFTTIAVSYPGTGHSTLGRYDEEQPWSIENLSSEIASLIFDLSGSGVIEDFNLTICGHSMGGKVALALLSKMIDTHFRIENVVLLAPAPPGPLVLPDEVRETSLSAYANEENVRRAVATVLTECALSEDDIARVVEDSVSMQGPAKTGWLEYGMAEDVRSTLISTLREQTNSSKSPSIVVLVGKEDKVEPPDRVQKATVDLLNLNVKEPVKVVVIEDCGHLIPLEQPDRVTKELAGLF